MADDQIAQDYAQRKERVATLTKLTLESTDGTTVQPTPTQEENDKAALGLLHPDEKAQAADKPMPPLAAQQAYLASGEALPQVQARPVAPPPRPPAPSVPRQTERS
jgi:hypothetical protein